MKNDPLTCWTFLFLNFSIFDHNHLNMFNDLNNNFLIIKYLGVSKANLNTYNKIIIVNN